MLIQHGMGESHLKQMLLFSARVEESLFKKLRRKKKGHWRAENWDNKAPPPLVPAPPTPPPGPYIKAWTDTDRSEVKKAIMLSHGQALPQLKWAPRGETEPWTNIGKDKPKHSLSNRTMDGLCKNSNDPCIRKQCVGWIGRSVHLGVNK